MKITIKIETSNAAFEGHNGNEIARIIQEQIADRVTTRAVEPGENWKLRDINGNTVGEFRASKR